MKVPSVRELFEFIVETNITEDNLGKFFNFHAKTRDFSLGSLNKTSF